MIAVDARERVAVPFWPGVLAVLGSLLVGFLVSFVAILVVVFALVLITGHAPSTAPGQALLGLGELVFYVAGGWFAWTRLRTMRMPFRRLTAADVRVLAISAGALLLVKVAAAVQLVLSHQTQHVQTGMEHFSVLGKTPLLTALTTGLAVAVMVVLGPLAEELAFRGLLFGALVRPLGTIAAAIVSSLIFGAVHDDLVLFPTLAALGLVSALAYAATGNLTVAVILHALNNLIAGAFLITRSLGTS